MRLLPTMSGTRLPNGATSVRVGANGERITITPMNAYRPPAADYLSGGRKTRLVPVDRIAAWARESLPANSPEQAELFDLLDALTGAPKFSAPVRR